VVPLPPGGGSRRRVYPTKRVGESAVRAVKVAPPRVILSEAKPEGQIALQFGSREKVKRKSYRKPFVDPASRPPLGRVRLRKQLTGLFAPLRMTGKGMHRAGFTHRRAHVRGSPKGSLRAFGGSEQSDAPTVKLCFSLSFKIKIHFRLKQYNLLS